MYRIIPHKLLYTIIAWLILGVYLGINSIAQWLQAELRLSSAITLGWLLISALLINPVWRWVWRRVPALGRWIFPDLNGEWDVEIVSNHSIHRQLADAAARRTEKFDIDLCPDCDLAPLMAVHLKAEIVQTWFKFEIVLENPAGNTPIRRSEVVSVDPFRGDGLKRGGLYYFFEQENETAGQSDERYFYGAARVEYDPRSDILAGLFWTERMWHRGLNTAGKIRYRRANAARNLPAR
ncbi:hypothetical protein [Sphingopyxis sp.]|uniref:hypothetical protein n=1 Tax=Sphingopyxis sp. TaxID=1908224 RepID=UPI00260A55B9|nr:hypothetical protein [Sphingopyxis sp.]MCW0197383.1 hypothetical protein [Sphingopyxis sp.]